jgi:signal transduction histidine kinase/CheY-like chemotaxis protein
VQLATAHIARTLSGAGCNLSLNHEEAARLSALWKCRILDTPTEKAFDELALLAARSCACPLALVSFVDSERVWIKAAIGSSRREYPRLAAPCASAIAHPRFAVSDLRADARFAAHPLVSEAPHARFYAAACIYSPDGQPIGALSVLDTQPRELSPAEIEALTALAGVTSAQVELHMLRDARLLKSEALLSAAQRIAGIGCWEWDMRTGEIQWSEEMFTIFKRTRDYVPELGGFMERLHPDERASMEAKIKDVMAHGRTTFPEYRIIWPDGSIRVLAVTAECQRDSDGSPLRLTGAVQDVTQQRRLEIERQQLSTQMLRTQKLESLGVLAAGVAHDFNNLLVGILGNAELAAQHAQSSPQIKELIEPVIEAAEQAAGLTRQLLAYTGRRSFQMRNVDLGTHVNGLSSLLRISLPKTTKLHLDLAPQLPEVCADLDQLQQVTMNLILNAAEANEGSESEVHVRTFLSEFSVPPSHTLTVPMSPRPGRYVVLEITDNGCGMDAGILERIFEPFFSTKFTGRGLGLAAVLGIVRGHDAVLSVDSTPGVGTTFRIYFSVFEKSKSTPAEQTAPLNDPHMTRLQQRGVLVVDDEPRVRAVARAVLEGAQMRVLEAEDGEQALTLFERRSGDIDIVLLDVVMPGPDAATIVRRLRAADPSLPIVLCSGYPEGEASRVLSALDGGRSAFLEKPFSPARLLETVWRTLG